MLFCTRWKRGRNVTKIMHNTNRPIQNRQTLLVLNFGIVFRNPTVHLDNKFKSLAATYLTDFDNRFDFFSIYKRHAHSETSAQGQMATMDLHEQGQVARRDVNHEGQVFTRNVDHQGQLAKRGLNHQDHIATRGLHHKGQVIKRDLRVHNQSHMITRDLHHQGPVTTEDLHHQGQGQFFLHECYKWVNNNKSTNVFSHSSSTAFESHLPKRQHLNIN